MMMTPNEEGPRRYVFISDIHGNLEALQAVLSFADKLEPFQLYCLGDIVGYGADPRECLEWGSALGASSVRAVGATESVFTRREAEAMIAAHPLRIETW